MAFWNTPDSDIRPRALPHRLRRPVARRRPMRRPSPEALEGRCLLSTTYSITDIAPVFSTEIPQVNPNPWVGINNASPAQVVAGEGPDGPAFIWDSVHGSKDLGTVKSEANSAGNGINDSGQVVGISWTTTVIQKKHNPWGVSQTTENGFLWTAGKMKDLGSDVKPNAINDSGEMIGAGSLWDGKAWTSLGTLPGGLASLALGLNNDGQVVGYVMNDQSHPAEGYLWSPSRPNGSSGSMIGLGSFDTTSPGQSNAAAINGKGWVTGWAENDDRSGGADHAFVWEPSSPNATTGTMVDLGTLANNLYPNWSHSEGLAINSSGVVVGDSDPAGSQGYQPDAVIWQPGAGGTYTLSDLNSLISSGTGWTLTQALAINDAGLIVAEGTQGGYSHALLLTPQTAATAVAARATPAPVPGAIQATATAPATSVGISAVEPEGSGSGSRSGPIPAAARAATSPVLQPIFDFALADLAARPRNKTSVNDRIARPMWAGPGAS